MGAEDEMKECTLGWEEPLNDTDLARATKDRGPGVNDPSGDPASARNGESGGRLRGD